MISYIAASPKPVRQFLRIGVFGWLVLWILTVPLFHIHTVSETRQGLPHTVFSPDLPGEYSAGPGESFRHDSPRNGRHHSGIHNGQSYPELGFTTPLPQAGKSLKPFQIMAYGAIPLFEGPGSPLCRHPTNILSLATQWFPNRLSPRAPPHSV